MKRFMKIILILAFTVSSIAFGACRNLKVLELISGSKHAYCDCGGKHLYLSVSKNYKGTVVNQKITEKLNNACNSGGNLPDSQTIVDSGEVFQGPEKYSFNSSNINFRNSEKENREALEKEKAKLDQYKSQGLAFSLNENGAPSEEFGSLYGNLTTTNKEQIDRSMASLNNMKNERKKIKNTFEKKVRIAGKKEPVNLYIQDDQGKYKINEEVKPTTLVFDDDKAIYGQALKDEVNYYGKYSAANISKEENKISQQVVDLGKTKIEDQISLSDDLLNATNDQMYEGVVNAQAHYKGIYETMCSEYQACLNGIKDKNVPYSCTEKKKGKEYNIVIINKEMKFPESEESNFPQKQIKDEKTLEITSIGEKSFESCSGVEGWAEFQVQNNSEIQSAVADLEERNEKQESDFSDEGNRREADLEKSKEFFAGKVEDSNINLNYCQDSVYKNEDERILAVGHAYAVIEPVRDADSRFRFSQGREITKPTKCASDDKNVFELDEMELYTNFEVKPLQKIARDRKNKICIGLAYVQEDRESIVLEDESQSVVCNDHLRAALNCREGSDYIANSKEGQHLSDISVDSRLAYSSDGLLLGLLTGNDGNPEKILFKNKPICDEFFWNKFNKCMGFNYKKVVQYAKKDAKKDPQEGKEQTPSPEQYNLAKSSLATEMGNQLWTCMAFRELAIEQADINDSSWEEGEQISSIDGRFTCQRIAPWTQDYKACKQLINTYSGFQIGNQARGMAGQSWSMVNQRNIQNDSMAASQAAQTNALEASKNGEQSNLHGDQVNIALDAQKKSYEHQKQKEQMNLGFHAANAGTLSVMLAKFPTPNKFAKKCSDGESETDAYCKASDVARNKRIRHELFPNQQAKKQMWGQVMQSSASAVLSAFKAAQYKKMAGDVGKYKDAFNHLNTDATGTTSEMEVGYCSLNPTAPGCQEKGPRVQGNGEFSYGNFGAQANGGGQYGFDQNSDMGDFQEGDAVTAAQQSAINDLGNIMNQDSAGRFDNGFKKVGQGSFKRDQLASGGGGGSGGGAASGGSYQGGSGGAGGGKNNAAFGGSKQKVSYGASSGKTKYGSARGSKQKKSANPFSNLFGKRKGRRVASQVTNDIAPSHSGLFEKISKRYTKMQQANRLYKLK